MSDERALVPIEAKRVDFYGDELTAALVEVGGRQEVLIPLRPICDFLGIDWSGQRQRILRDRVLSAVVTEVVMSVGVTPTDISVSSRRPRSSAMLCLPLEYLNGWVRLFTRRLIADKQLQVVSNTCKGNKVSIRRKNGVNIASL